MRPDLKPTTYLEKVDYTEASFQEFLKLMENDEIRSKFVLDYPTVYVIYTSRNSEWQGPKYEVYIGESNSIRQRTNKHLKGDVKLALDYLQNPENFADLSSGEKAKLTASQNWLKLRDEDSTMFVIANTLFTKSMSLDVENKLLLYLGTNETTEEVKCLNRRTNDQLDYFTKDQFDEVFTDIWKKLRKHDKKLFPLEKTIKDSALFKASPFHKLTEEQVQAKQQIVDATFDVMRSPDLSEIPASEDAKLILVQGAAGTGKTVLMSSLFYDFYQGEVDQIDDVFDYQDLDAYLLVNHDEQLKVYETIAEKLGIHSKKRPRVLKPTSFINKRKDGERVDVVLIDEAHLLWTQGKQSYRGNNQLKDILKLARVVIAIFDPMQALAGNQFWEESLMKWLFDEEKHTVIELTQQMRIDSDGPAEKWIRTFLDKGVVTPLPKPGEDKYEIRIFEDPTLMHEAIRPLATEETTLEKGISRLIATYDWKFTTGYKPEGGGPWCVEIGEFSKPWNNQRDYTREEKRENKMKSWAERPQTIDEVGSIFTIQGFDLNYAAVIIGPSVRMRNGILEFDASKSFNPNVIRKRTMSDGSKVSVAEDLLRNQLNVLMTRGVRGLYIYAVDDELRKALLEAQATS